ncbi:MAG TPA: cell division protein FtsB [Burkholderiales bacterium]|nr:cell division protein FtsB [Burkholderiales bacterium]
MRWLTVILLGLLLLLQYPLWLGRGGWFKVWDTRQQVVRQQHTDDTLAARNAAMDAEVRDLKQGVRAIEARARTELGMVRKDEIFFQILDAPPAEPVIPPAPPAAASEPSHGIAR